MFSEIFRFRRLTFHWLLVCLLYSSFNSAGQDQILLTNYLQQSREAGFNILYSNELVPDHLLVSVPDQEPINLDSIASVLASVQLELQAIAGGYVVVKPDLVEVHEIASIPDVISTPPSIEELIVTSSRYRLLQRETANAAVSHSEIQRRASLANDGLRVVSQLPGTASNGVSVLPRVRGGKDDETLILFDGVELFNPVHLKNFHSLFSALDGRIIEHIDFYSGAFPARYGDRLSGVMDIESVDPATNGFGSELGLGIYNASYLYQTREQDSGWLVDLRRSTLNIPASLLSKDYGVPVFSDAFIKYDRELKNGDRLSFNVLWYGDKSSINKSARTEVSKALYSSSYAWLRADQTWSEDIYSETWLVSAFMHQNRKGSTDKPGLVSGWLRDYREFNLYTLKQDVHYLVSDTLLAELGWRLDEMEGEYRFASEINVDPRFTALTNFTRTAVYSRELEPSGGRSGVYLSIKKFWHPRFSTETGARLDRVHYEGFASVEDVSPRVALLFDVTDNTSIRLGWGKFSQADRIDELRVGDRHTDHLEPQTVTHQVLGLTHVADSGISIRIEGYRKLGTEESIYFENLTNSLNLTPEIYPDRQLVSPEEYVSRGFEISLDNTRSGKTLQWWFSYIYSIVEDHIASRKVRRSWDQTHSSQLGVSGMLGNWQYTLSGSYHTGWPTTPVSYNDSTGGLVIGNRNSIHFEHYMSWDIKFLRSWEMAKGRGMRLEMGITNLLNRENQIGVEYGLSGDNELITSRQTAPLIAPFLDLYFNF